MLGISPWSPNSGTSFPCNGSGTVDGRNPAPVDMVNIPLFTGFSTSQVVPDFFHQQHGNSMGMVVPLFFFPPEFPVQDGCRLADGETESSIEQYVDFVLEQ